MKLIKTTILGEMGWHVFTKDGQFKVVTFPAEDYPKVGTGEIKPAYLDWQWLHSALGTKYDTKSGFLEDGYYVDLGDGMIEARVGQKRFTVAAKEITDDTLSAQGVTDVYEKGMKVVPWQ